MISSVSSWGIVHRDQIETDSDAGLVPVVGKQDASVYDNEELTLRVSTYCPGRVRPRSSWR